MGGQHDGNRNTAGGQHPAVFLHHCVHISGSLCQVAMSIAKFRGDEDRVPRAQGVRQRSVLQAGKQDVGAGQDEQGDRTGACIRYMKLPAVHGDHFFFHGSTSRGVLTAPPRPGG